MRPARRAVGGLEMAVTYIFAILPCYETPMHRFGAGIAVRSHALPHACGGRL